MAWLRANWKVAGVCAVLCLCVIAFALDGYRTRKLLKAAQVNLEENAKAKEKELAAAKETADKRLSESDRKLAPVLRERDALRAKLAEIEARATIPWEAPGSDEEIVNRFNALGYRVGIKR